MYFVQVGADIESRRLDRVAAVLGERLRERFIDLYCVHVVVLEANILCPQQYRLEGTLNAITQRLTL